jgi:hypothetical protein
MSDSPVDPKHRMVNSETRHTLLEILTTTLTPTA